MIKAIFFDLDGTLLDNNKKIPVTTIEALNVCKSKGIQLFIATARPPLLKKMLAWTEEEILLFDGGTYCNGGCIKVNGQDEYVYIPENVVEKCIEQVKEYDKLNIALQLKNEVHAFRYPLSDIAYEKWGIEKVNSLNIDDSLKKETVKILIHYENIIDSLTPIPDSLIKTLETYCGDKATMYITDNDKVIQIVNKLINKKESIEKIRKYLSIEKDEVAVFGDDVNDMEMLAEYKNSVAMGNAKEYVKEVAGYVTLDNDNDGIAYALHNLLRVI